MDTGFEWVTRYGYAGIFLLLMLGIVGLPVPDEALLTFVGYLSFKGELAFVPSLAAAFLGSSTGISLSYGIGRFAGSQVVAKLAPVLHLSPEHLASGQAWVQRWGKYALLFAYFVPGVRHLVAMLAGASNLPLHVFAPLCLLRRIPVVDDIHCCRVWPRGRMGATVSAGAPHSRHRGDGRRACNSRRTVHHATTRSIGPFEKVRESQWGKPSASQTLMA